MFGLLINPQPHHDESLLGYLQRLAKVNGLPGKELISAFSQADEVEVADWLQSIDPPVSWPAVAAEYRAPKAKAFKVWTFRRSRYCPFCLDETDYWREAWGVTLITTCSVHNTELQDRCPNCLKETNHSSMLANSCKACGTTLGEHKHEISPASASDAWLTSIFEDKLRAVTLPGGSGLAALSYQELHELSSRLAVRSVRTESSKPLKVADSGSLEVSRYLAHAAGEILMNWPRAFRDLLSDLRDVHSDGKGWKLTTAFGPIYRDIHHDLNAPCFDFVRSEFESFLKNAWEAPLAKRNRLLSDKTVEEHRWVTIDEGAKATGIPVSVVRRLYQHGQLEYREVISGGKRVFKAVNLGQLRETSLCIKGAVNMMQAARLLHISTVRVRQLIAAGIIHVFGGEPRHGESWLIDGKSIDDLSIERIISGAENDLVTVSYLAQHHLPAGGGLVELIQAIRSGEIRAYRNADEEHTTLGHWLLKPQDLTAWLHTSFHGKSSEFPGVSVGKAAVLLGLKEEVAYSFVRLGLLWSTSVKRGRCTQQMVKPDAIDRFRRRYILGPEIAVYLGMSPKDSLKHLWEIRIRPIAGPTILTAACRQYVWARSKKLVDYLVWKAAHCEVGESN